MSLQQNGSADFINVSRSLIPGAARLQKVGYNPAVGQSLLTVWNEASLYAFPSSASTMTVSSASASDTAAGTGARTITVSGLDATYASISETVILNGQTGVSTVNSYLRVNTLSVATAGSGGSNAGIIYIGTGSITTGKPATVYGSIAAGFNTSQQAFTTIPAGSTGYLVNLLASTDTATTQIQIYTRPQGGIFSLNRIFQLGVGAGTIQEYQLPRALTAGSDIEARAIVGTGTAKISCQFEILMMTPS